MLGIHIDLYEPTQLIFPSLDKSMVNLKLGYSLFPKKILPIISVLWRQRESERKLKASQGYIVRPYLKTRSTKTARDTVW